MQGYNSYGIRSGRGEHTPCQLILKKLQATCSTKRRWINKMLSVKQFDSCTVKQAHDHLHLTIPSGQYDFTQLANSKWEAIVMNANRQLQVLISVWKGYRKKVISPHFYPQFQIRLWKKEKEKTYKPQNISAQTKNTLPICSGDKKYQLVFSSCR